MTKYSPAYKERVVREYQKGVRGRGFAALSKRFKIPKSVIEDWWKKWIQAGQTIEAFAEEVGGDRKSVLTEKEKERYILDFVSHKNAKGEAVDYPDVHAYVVNCTQKDISIRSVQRIGKEEMGISWKQTTQSLVTDGMNSTICALIFA